MTSASFRVVTRGLQPDYPADLAADQLILLFKCTRKKIAPLLTGRRFTVRKGMTQEAAEKYARALARCGCVCAVEAVAPPPVPLTRQQTLDVIPVLRRIEARSAEADPVVTMPFAGDLEIVFRIEAQGPLVRQAALKAAMMTAGELYDIAVWNLYVALLPKMTFQRIDAGHDADGQAGIRFFSHVDTGDGLDAACLLLLPVWENAAAHVQGPLRVMVPDAHSCYFCGADDAASLALMSDRAHGAWQAAGDAALSPLTYAVDAQGRVTIVPGADARHAPPPGEYVRTAAQLRAPVAYGLASNPALVPLSERRLRRLQPQLFDVARWPQEAQRVDRIDDLRKTLARGDAHAAVVVDAVGGVVAAYTDELDCVVMLKFGPALASRYGWQDGTRLLAAMTYAPRWKGVASDLLPGPGDTARWGNACPLIADLLTEDRAALATSKQTIDEAEWTRALNLGRRMVAAGGIARDGRPLGAGQPKASHTPADRQAPAPAAAPADPAAPPRNSSRSSSRSSHHGRSRRRRRTTSYDTFHASVRNAGIGLLCAGAAWGAGHQAMEMQDEGLFFVTCLGILLLSFIGLGCLWSAANTLRRA